MHFIPLSLVDGPEIDILPSAVLLVEAFDEQKNTNYPDAAAFVIFRNSQGLGQAIVNNTFEELDEAISEVTPGRFFEVTTLPGNRSLIANDSVQERIGLEQGTGLTLFIDGQFRTLQVSQTLEEVRSLMSAPPGLIEPEPEPTPE